ncbi:MAG: hypothetical protein JNL96_00520 [Planctomycetaceae bacterium]|nr:hypothetical protein [Planctomycetaceae bacterium]
MNGKVERTQTGTTRYNLLPAFHNPVQGDSQTPENMRLGQEDFSAEGAPFSLGQAPGTITGGGAMPVGAMGSAADLQLAPGSGQSGADGFSNSSGLGNALLYEYCFAAETLVRTRRGDVPIWVRSGDGLAVRETPRHLDVLKDENRGLAGRWIDSHELRVGDEVVCRDGVMRVVTQIDRCEVVDHPVYNLTIRDCHTFAVGTHAVLVHNSSWCDDYAAASGRIVPGKLKTIMAANGFDDSRLHGHHIVMRGAGDEASVASRKILKEYDIDVVYEQKDIRSGNIDNLCFAINGYDGLHSLDYRNAVHKKLNDTVIKGVARGDSKAAITKQLKKDLQTMRHTIEQGKRFW